MKRTLFILGCLASGMLGMQAQELQDPYWVSDFENDEALYWNPIGGKDMIEIVDNPLKDDVNASNKVLKLTLPKGETYAGAIITVDNLPVGDAAGHYRYGRVKFYKPQTGTSILKMQQGPNGDREVSQTVEGGTWVDVAFAFNFAANNDAGAIGAYKEVYIIGNTTDYEGDEFVMYIDDVMFTNPPLTINDGLPATTDELAVLDNFENGKVNFTQELKSMEGASFGVVDNPKKDKVNGSKKVLEIVRPQDAAAWAGFYAQLNENAAPKCDMDKYRYARFKVLQDVAGASARFKVEFPGGDNVEKEPLTSPEKVNEWEEIIFDMDEAAGLYPQVVVMPDFADNRPVHTVYIDDIMFSKELDVETPGTSVELLSVANSLRTVIDGNRIDVLFFAKTDAAMTLSIYDATGRTITVQQVNAEAGENRVSLNIERSGIFLVKVSRGNKSVISKFCK